MMHDQLPKENFLGELPSALFQDGSYLSYVEARKPVVIKNLSDEWPAAKAWNFDYLRKKINSNLNILVKDLKSAQQVPMNFLAALAQIENQVGHASDNEGICLQMGQIITRGPYLRSKPVLSVLSDDFTIPAFVLHSHLCIAKSIFATQILKNFLSLKMRNIIGP